ncbi:MAG TPA: efflux RND transporter periplasmic adaptor subunit [Planctomycetota bacterium]|nr:efflux RND transporter periplasmic adaptor subunit [Planctomycetota bacterium]
MNRRLIVVPVLLAAAMIAWLIVRSAKHPAAGGIRVSGNIEATEVELAFRLPGWIESRAADEGEQVKADQVVARLDARELSQEAGARRADAEAAKALLAQLEAGSRPEEVAAAEAAAARARAEAVAAKADRARAEGLYRDKVITEQEFQARKALGDAAEAAAAQAEAQLRLVRAGPRKEEVDQARARAEAARQVAELSDTRLGYAVLRSPLSGTVLSKAAEPGEYVSAGTPVVTVADLGRVYLRAYVNETDLGRVKLGAPVAVTADTWPGRTYKGKVAFIASQAEFTPKNIQTHKERVRLVYRVKIEIANPEMALKPGMPADADIAAE